MLVEFIEYVKDPVLESFFFSIWHKLKLFGKKKTSTEKIPPTTGLWGIFMIDDWSGWTTFLVDVATRSLEVLGFIRRQAEQAIMIKPLSHTPPWPLHQFLPPGSCFEFLSWLLLVVMRFKYCKLKYTFSFTSCFRSACFITAIESLT